MTIMRKSGLLALCIAFGFSTHSLKARSCLRNLVHSGPSCNLGVSLTSLHGPGPSLITSKISLTCAECMMTVVTPAAVANSAASSLVDMPPVPRDVPSVAVETACQRLALLAKRAKENKCTVYSQTEVTWWYGMVCM
jgi:hypothetical protein